MAKLINGTDDGETLTGSNDHDRINGLGGNDTLHGLGGSDSLDGGTGDDVMFGGLGNDLYLVDSPGDAVIEPISGGGTDTVVASITYALGARVENLALSALAGAINGTGNALNNVISGNESNNVLAGGAGNDRLIGNGSRVDPEPGSEAGGVDIMFGQTGDDTYVVDSPSDLVSEGAGAGNDKVESLITYTLTANFEQLTLSPFAGAINGTGNSLANVIRGNRSNNVLSGGAGNDRLHGGGDVGHPTGGSDSLFGGTGNDFYEINGLEDAVLEQAGAGIDTVHTSVSYTLAPNVEILTMSPTGALNGTGNKLANTITGNGISNQLSGGGGNDTLYGGSSSDTLNGDAGHDTLDGGIGLDTLNGGDGNDTLLGGFGAHVDTLNGGIGADTLDGGLGADKMFGGANSDVYFVNVAGDDVTEDENAGTDHVKAIIAYTLDPNVENLTLLGVGAHDGTGNDLANLINGNEANNVLTGLGGNDVLNGRGGVDDMAGGHGNDFYHVDDAGDVVTESSAVGAGVADAVFASISYYLTDNVEKLMLLTAGGAINGIGNALGNTINGNSSANTLIGRGGNDVVTGGAGADGFFFTVALNAATNVDEIKDFDVTNDTIRLDDAIFTGFGPLGVINADAFHIGAAAADAEDRIIYNSATGALSFDTNGNAAGAATQFATLATGLALTNADILTF